MSILYERIRNETQQSLIRDSEPANLKGCTVRLLPEYIALIDKLAEQLDESRQTFLNALICDAVDEALSAYASVFTDPAEVHRQFRESCGFVYGTATQTQFADFCSMNALDPRDPSSMSDFEMVVDHMEENKQMAIEAMAAREGK